MSVSEIASRFNAARKSAQALADFPGQVPATLDEAYAVQEASIALWDRPVVGWKIGRLAPDKQAIHDTERLTGPIFASLYTDYAGDPVTVPVFAGGFAAVEAEFVFRVGVDTDPAKTAYSEAEALGVVDAMFAGIEMAGSPLSTINVLGPTVVASDFGNNFGLILGEKLLSFDDSSTTDSLDAEAVKAFGARTEIDGALVGEGGLFTMPGGPLKAIGWLAGHLAARGRPLRRGQFISSGATTGIHDIVSGQSARVTYNRPDSGTFEMAVKTVTLTSDSSVLV